MSRLPGTPLAREIDARLNHVRAAIRNAGRTFRPDPGETCYARTPDGDINLADLAGLAPEGMGAADFERRVSIMYNGDEEQRRDMLDHWDDGDYSDYLVDEVEDTGQALDYDLAFCEDWRGR